MDEEVSYNDHENNPQTVKVRTVLKNYMNIIACYDLKITYEL